jgi:hypothetical protein
LGEEQMKLIDNALRCQLCLWIKSSIRTKSIVDISYYKK